MKQSIQSFVENFMFCPDDEYVCLYVALELSGIRQVRQSTETDPALLVSTSFVSLSVSVSQCGLVN